MILDGSDGGDVEPHPGDAPASGVGDEGPRAVVVLLHDQGSVL